MGVKVHVCFDPNLSPMSGSPEKIRARLERCRCKKEVSVSDATRQVSRNVAQWVVFSKKLLVRDEICPICQGGDTKRGCQNCSGFGIVHAVFELDKVSDRDIVLSSAVCKDEKGRDMVRSAKAKQTPRVATIEEEHIERAYVYGNKEEQKRMAIYGLATILVRLPRTAEKAFLPIRPEPVDDLETGTGRRYDYGRTIFCALQDGRTPGGVGK